MLVGLDRVEERAPVIASAEFCVGEPYPANDHLEDVGSSPDSFPPLLGRELFLEPCFPCLYKHYRVSAPLWVWS